MPGNYRCCWVRMACLGLKFSSRDLSAIFDPISLSRSFSSQILVLHFPGVIERMIRGVPNQVPELPGAGDFALGMKHRIALQ